MTRPDTEPRTPMAGVILLALLLRNAWGFLCLMSGVPEYQKQSVSKGRPVRSENEGTRP
jgi:hypothetical protein